ncbi:WD40 repeat domain-containing protein [Kibdelosporangium banguiense]|uniref:WD40 repeat domain-containing protein n=1 Tax=Kibdelosporangium banguiense TaxID=1365924 RepID=UPI001AE777C4|nr:WD40 repeat domain-containing protein [Kibdelosporangium banguiense]
MIWDIQNGARPLELAGSGSAAQEIVTTVEFSPDGKQFATGTSDGTIRLWDLPSGTLRGKIAAHVGMVGALTYSPDGSRIASLGREDHLVGLWNTTDHRQVMSWQHGGPRAGLTFSPDGRVLACSGENDNLFLWDVTTGAALPLGLHGAEAVDYSPDGKTIATVNAEGHLAIWDLVTATRRPTPEIGRRINDVAYTSDGQAVVSVDTNGAVRLTDVARGITLTEIATGESNGLHTVTTAADGTIAAAGETAALLWKPAELPYIGGEVSTDLTFGPNGRSILATGQFHTLVSWDVAKPAQPIVEIANADPNADSHQVFSPDGARLARMTPNGQVVVYDVASGTHIAELNVKAGFLQPMAFSPDGRLLAIGGGSTVVWDIGRRHPVTELGSSFSRGLMFSPDGRQLAITGNEAVTVWDVVTNGVVGSLRHNAVAVAYSADRTRLATTGIDGTVKIWDARTLDHLADLTGRQGRLRAATFRPDGRLLATIGETDPDIILWDTATWSAWATLKGHSLPVNAATWGRDGVTLATASKDRTIATWYTDTDQATQHICHTVALHSDNGKPASC